MPVPDSSTHTDTSLADLGFGLNAQRRVLLVADMVESVRLMQRHEWDTTQRWRSLVQTLVQDVLPAHQGTLVQRRGDGLMLEFETVTGATAAAFECHRRADAANQGRLGDQHIVLRMGLHQAEVLADGIDLYGAGVQLSHRLAALAQPGETLCTAEVRDELTDGLQASVCDKGERLLPGQEDPVRVYQLQPVGNAPRSLLRWAPESLLPRVAFVAAQTYANPDWNTVCQLVVTELTAAASRVTTWRVISALSTRRLTAQGLQDLNAQGEQRLADYVVQVGWGRGDSADSSDRRATTPVITLRCTDVRCEHTLWQQDVAAPPQAWVASQEGLAADMARDLATTLLAREVRIAHDSALHSLPGYALLLAAIGLTHHTTTASLTRADQILSHLSARHPRSTEVHFWRGNWGLMAGLQGFAHLEQVTQRSLEALKQAQELEPGHAASMGLAAHLCEILQLPAPDSGDELSQLIKRSPNDANLWYYNACSDRSSQSATPKFAIQCARTAIEISPLDPQKARWLTSLSLAHFKREDQKEALAFAEMAVNANSVQLASLAVLMACQWEAGQHREARLTAQHYLALRPAAKVSIFLKYRSEQEPFVTHRLASAMAAAGIPWQ